MEALEVGMFVRVKNIFSGSCITKIKHISYKEPIGAKKAPWIKTEVGLEGFVGEQDKASHNIIDLIEENDILELQYEDKLVVEEMIYDPERKEMYAQSDDGYGRAYNDDIKAIVTHEQFEEDKYKVVE